jgi:hypothetical protein
VWWALQLIKKAATDEEKKLSKADKERRQDFYGYAIVDGRIEKVRHLCPSSRTFCRPTYERYFNRCACQ